MYCICEKCGNAVPMHCFPDANLVRDDTYWGVCNRCGEEVKKTINRLADRQSYGIYTDQEIYYVLRNMWAKSILNIYTSTLAHFMCSIVATGPVVYDQRSGSVEFLDAEVML